MKRVDDDLGREMLRLCLSAHSATRAAWAERASEAWGIDEDEEMEVKSSA